MTSLFIFRVQSLEEELTRKEERWNVTFTRLKNKAEAKEQECVELHKQISVLEQEKIALWEKEVSVSSFSVRQQSQHASAVSVRVSRLCVRQQSYCASAVSACVSSLSMR